MWLNLCSVYTKTYLCFVKRGFTYSVFLFLICACANQAFAGKIKRGYQALEVYNYFKAKKLFEHAIKYNESPASFGLSVIYARRDNPFYSLDSAYKYVLRSEKTWDNASEGKKLRWKHFGWTEQGIDSLRNRIDHQVFLEAREKNTVEAYSKFIVEHPYYEGKDAVIRYRDSIAFFQAVYENTSEAYRLYIEAYKDSKYQELAQVNFYDMQFEEITNEGRLIDYLTFVETNADSPLVPDAQQRIYEIVTQPNTISAYEVFIDKYSENPYVEKAWKELYQMYISAYASERIKAFQDRYRNHKGYPMDVLVRGELALADSVFLPFKKGSKFGFMNREGQTVLPAVYDEVGFFREGLSIVAFEGKFGVINKLGEVLIPFTYDGIGDFVMGRALVEKNNKTGMIHRNGREILECKYEDVGMPAEGLIFVSIEGKYAYYDEAGRERIAPRFDEAFDFNEGKALVEMEGKQAFIDMYGAYVVPPVYENIRWFSDSLCVFGEDGKYGLMNRLGKPVSEMRYDGIGELTEDGLAIFSVDGAVGYLNASGELAIDVGSEVFPNYLSIGEFKKGAAIVSREGQFGRIDTDGTALTALKFKNLHYTNGYLSYQKEELWGIMNGNNVSVVPARYEAIYDVSGDFVVAELEGLTGAIDVTGRQWVPFVYESVRSVAENVFVVEREEKLGIYAEGKLLVPEVYDAIESIETEFLLLTEGDNFSYLDLQRREIIRMQEQ